MRYLLPPCLAPAALAALVVVLGLKCTCSSEHMGRGALRFLRVVWFRLVRFCNRASATDLRSVGRHHLANHITGHVITYRPPELQQEQPPTSWDSTWYVVSTTSAPTSLATSAAASRSKSTGAV